MITVGHLTAALCSKYADDRLKEHTPKDSAKQSKLIYAAHCGNEKFIREQIEINGSVDDQEQYGHSLLSIAIARNECRIVNILIGSGGDLCSKGFNGITPIHLAVKSKPEVMKAVFTKVNIHNIDVADDFGRTPLHWAAALGSELACRYLLQLGSNPTKLDLHRRTPLHWLAISENFDEASNVATFFLRSYSDLLKWQDARGATPYSLAACSGNVELMETFLKHGDREVINRADNLFRTPLHYACALGHSRMIKHLLDTGADAGIPDCEGATAVHLAAYWNHLECLKELTDYPHSWDVDNLFDRSGLNPLHWAVARRCYNPVEILCKRVKTLPYSLLMIASTKGDDAIVDLLLSNGAQISSELEPKTASTALIKAASHGHMTVMMALIHRGNADTKQSDLRGRTALHWAAMSGSPETCTFLLGTSCPYDATDYLGCTALHCAAFSSAECVKVLLKYLPIDCKDRYGFTPLHWACLGRNSSSVKLLIKSGAGINILGKTSDRQTPLDCALRRNATDVVDLLIASGCTTAHGLRERSAAKIQAIWRAYRVRKTLKVVKCHELNLTSNSNSSPFNDGIVDAVYYGMGRKTNNINANPEHYDDDFEEETSTLASEEISPPLISSKMNTGDFRTRLLSNRGVRFEGPGQSQRGSQGNSNEPTYEVVDPTNIDESNDDQYNTEESKRHMSMASIAAVVNKAKNTASKYIKSKDQEILEKSDVARKLRVVEMERVEAVRSRFVAASTIQRAWKRYKRQKKSQTKQKLTARQMRLRAGEHAWKRQTAAITLQNAWRKHHRNEVIKTVEQHPEFKQVQSPMSHLMKSTRQAVLVSSIYTLPSARRPTQTTRSNADKARPSVKPLAELSKPRPAAISFNFALTQYTRPVTSSVSFRSNP